MTISTGERLPDADFLVIRGEERQILSVSELTEGKTVVFFGLPGAFTSTCDRIHLPSFIRTADGFRKKGVDTIACISVNDPQVMRAWGSHSGANDTGILMLADAASTFTGAIGMAFDAPAAGYFARSKRYSMLVKDRMVSVFNLEANAGICELTTGEELLGQI